MLKIAKPGHLTGDFWGGLAAMLVALPSAIAFGVTIYTPLGGSYIAYGALAGILGVTALGLVASVVGGTNRLITAPCAPAAAVLSAYALEAMHGASPESVLLSLILLGLVAGLLQVTFGLVGLGHLIKYMPYPVVSGYLSGVGLYIIASQVPKLLGVPKDVHFWESLVSIGEWRWEGIVVGLASITVMVIAPRITKRIPAAILSLAAGLITYFILGLFDDSLRNLKGNNLVIGALGSGAGGGFLEIISARWEGIKDLNMHSINALVMPALTLAILLSIDTLKTCVVLDALTRSRHNSNRELLGQGLGNITSALIGGMPGAGTMGATLVNMSSGAMTRLSGIIEGILALFAFLILSKLIAWVPVATLSGILIVIGFRMMDRDTLHYLKHRSTILDFTVIAAVVITALTVSLIAASGTGIFLAVLLFIREQIGGRVVHRKTYGNKIFSRQIRMQPEMEVLAARGDQTVIFQLQGSLFFGTTDQLYTALEPELKTRKYLILDMRRVQSVDITATHILQQIMDTLAERNASLIFCDIPRSLPSGRDMQQYFDQVGLIKEKSPIHIFSELSDALEWTEDKILQEASLERGEVKPLDLHEIELFHGRKLETLGELETSMDKRSYKAGERIFAMGDADQDLFIIRLGEVRILFPYDGGYRHISTFGRGAFFEEMSFLDRGTRSATAVASADTDLYVLSRDKFNTFAESHKKISLNLMEGLARVLAARLRYTNAEIQALFE
jgi:SulP family sulfate permease